MTSDITLYDRI